jgi:hypothetical protein
LAHQNSCTVQWLTPQLRTLRRTQSNSQCKRLVKLKQSLASSKLNWAEADLEYNGSDGYLYQPNQKALHLNLRLKVQEYTGKFKWLVEILPDWLLHLYYGSKVKERAYNAHTMAVGRCQMPFPARFIAASKDFAYKHSPKESTFIVNLGTVQRMNIHHIQKEILEVVRKLEDLRTKTVEERELTLIMATVKSLMADYGKPYFLQMWATCVY